MLEKLWWHPWPGFLLFLLPPTIPGPWSSTICFVSYLPTPTSSPRCHHSCSTSPPPGTASSPPRKANALPFQEELSTFVLNRQKPQQISTVKAYLWIQEAGLGRGQGYSLQLQAELFLISVSSVSSDVLNTSLNFSEPQ